MAKTTETGHRGIAKATETTGLPFLEGLANLERRAPRRLFSATSRELRPVIHSQPEVRAISLWHVVEESSTTTDDQAKRSGGLSPETQALRDWIESDDLDWDGIEHARNEAWGD